MDDQRALREQGKLTSSRWGINPVHRSLIIASAVLGAFMALPGHSQEIDIKAATDGRCDYWLPMLQANPAERVVFTGTDQHGEKVKVLSDGKRWRFVLLAGAEKPMFGCVFLEGGGEIVR